MEAFFAVADGFGFDVDGIAIDGFGKGDESFAAVIGVDLFFLVEVGDEVAGGVEDFGFDEFVLGLAFVGDVDFDAVGFEVGDDGVEAFIFHGMDS